MRPWSFRLASGAVLLTIVGGLVASFGWATGGTPELVAMGLPAWAAVTGLMAIMCFAIGAPAAGLAFCACLAGAAVGAEMLVDGRQPYSAALGATVGTVIGGLLGFLIRRRVDPCLPGVMRWMAIVLGVGGIVLVGGARAVLEGEACRPTFIGGLCHLDAIVAMAVIDLAIVGSLLLVAALRCPDA